MKEDCPQCKETIELAWKKYRDFCDERNGGIRIAAFGFGETCECGKTHYSN